MKRKFLDRPQKPHLLKVTPPVEHSFVIKGDSIAWNNPWHFHPEIELLFCVKGRGTNYVGNYVAPIEEGEILLFGKNLPHTRQRDRNYYAGHSDQEPETIVVQFHDQFLGQQLFELHEFVAIKSLLNKATRGLRFTGLTRERVAAELFELTRLEGLNALLKLLSILDLLGKSDDFTYLNAESFVKSYTNSDTQKINRVFAYVNDHFRDRISLMEAAEICSLTPAAFCRYFKARAKKSFLEYVNHVRIDYACSLLTLGTLDITEVAFESGFNNMSNFQKQFRKVMNTTPSAYREISLRKVSR